jgi:hypothetical protein
VYYVQSKKESPGCCKGYTEEGGCCFKGLIGFKVLEFVTERVRSGNVAS